MAYPRPTNTECKAIRHCISFVEEPGSFPRGVGDKTLRKLHDAGLIEWSHSEMYDKTGYIATEHGKEALDANAR